MFLNAVILILQETIEAALIISVLLALGHRIGIESRWILPALVAGFVGALALGLQLHTISSWLDYTGQEICNALLQLGIVVCLLFLSVRTGSRAHNRETILAMGLIVVMAIAREGSEVFIYLYSFRTDAELLSTTLLGGAIGAGTGICGGVLLYYLLGELPDQIALRIAAVLVALVAGSMALQAVMQLEQADYLPATAILWNSSGLVAEDSITGQVLYALVGYEATPSLLQGASYALAALLALAGFYLRLGSRRRNSGLASEQGDR